jgi:hypothetical protein
MTATEEHMDSGTIAVIQTSRIVGSVSFDKNTKYELCQRSIMTMMKRPLQVLCTSATREIPSLTSE